MMRRKAGRHGNRSALGRILSFAVVVWCGPYLLSHIVSAPPVAFTGVSEPPSAKATSLVSSNAFARRSRHAAFTILPGLQTWTQDMPVVVPAVGIPAIAMLVGGLIAGRLEISASRLCASQYFSAGMILAVCGNLASEMSGHGPVTILVMSLAFAFGVGLMVAVKKLTDTDAISDVDGTGNQLMKKFPWPLAFAVAIDSLVDGLLLGMLGVESPRAVLVVSTATAMEMGALGLSFAAALQEQPGRARTAALIGMPMALVIGGLAGSLAAAPLQDSPLAITAMLSFGISALIYLVTQELLVEAHSARQEIDDSGSLNTSAFLFAGYLLVLILDTLESGSDAE